MRTFLTSLALGLVGGFAGAALFSLWQGTGGAVPGASATEGRSGAELARRVTALEEARRETASGPRLAGRSAPAGPDAAGSPTGGLSTEELGALSDAVLEKLEPRLKDRVRESVAAVEAERKEKEEESQKPKRMPLADVAREMGLSASEEDELRSIYDEGMRKTLELMAKPDGDVEQVKRDWETYKTNPAERGKLMSKYMPRLFQHLGDFMAIEAEQQTRIQATLGAERAARYGTYDVEEAHPFDMTASFGVQADGER